MDRGAQQATVHGVRQDLETNTNNLLFLRTGFPQETTSDPDDSQLPVSIALASFLKFQASFWSVFLSA